MKFYILRTLLTYFILTQRICFALRSELDDVSNEKNLLNAMLDKLDFGNKGGASRNEVDSKKTKIFDFNQFLDRSLDIVFRNKDSFRKQLLKNAVVKAEKPSELEEKTEENKLVNEEVEVVQKEEKLPENPIEEEKKISEKKNGKENSVVNKLSKSKKGMKEKKESNEIIIEEEKKILEEKNEKEHSDLNALTNPENAEKEENASNDIKIPKKSGSSNKGSKNPKPKLTKQQKKRAAQALKSLSAKEDQPKPKSINGSESENDSESDLEKLTKDITDKKSKKDSQDDKKDKPLEEIYDQTSKKLGNTPISDKINDNKCEVSPLGMKSEGDSLSVSAKKKKKKNEMETSNIPGLNISKKSEPIQNNRGKEYDTKKQTDSKSVISSIGDKEQTNLSINEVATTNVQGLVKSVDNGSKKTVPTQPPAPFSSANRSEQSRSISKTSAGSSNTQPPSNDSKMNNQTKNASYITDKNMPSSKEKTSESHLNDNSTYTHQPGSYSSQNSHLMTTKPTNNMINKTASGSVSTYSPSNGSSRSSSSSETASQRSSSSGYNGARPKNFAKRNETDYSSYRRGRQQNSRENQSFYSQGGSQFRGDKIKVNSHAERSPYFVNGQDQKINFWTGPGTNNPQERFQQQNSKFNGNGDSTSQFHNQPENFPLLQQNQWLVPFNGSQNNPQNSMLVKSGGIPLQNTHPFTEKVDAKVTVTVQLDDDSKKLLAQMAEKIKQLEEVNHQIFLDKHELQSKINAQEIMLTDMKAGLPDHNNGEILLDGEGNVFRKVKKLFNAEAPPKDKKLGSINGKPAPYEIKNGTFFYYNENQAEAEKTKSVALPNEKNSSEDKIKQESVQSNNEEDNKFKVSLKYDENGEEIDSD